MMKLRMLDNFKKLSKRGGQEESQVMFPLSRSQLGIQKMFKQSKRSLRKHQIFQKELTLNQN